MNDFCIFCGLLYCGSQYSATYIQHIIQLQVEQQDHVSDPCHFVLEIAMFVGSISILLATITILGPNMLVESAAKSGQVFPAISNSYSCLNPGFPEIGLPPEIIRL